MAIKGYSTLLKALLLLEPHHQIVLCHIQNTRWWGLTLLQRYNRCIQQPQPIGLRWFNIISRTLVGGILPLSIYSAALADWAIQHTCCRSLTSLQRSSQCVLQLTRTGTWRGKFFMYQTKMYIIIIMSCLEHGYPDPLSPLLPIVHHLGQVFRATSRILT